FRIDDVKLTGNTLGISENTIADLKVYPNPVTNGKLFITTVANVEKTIAIYDVLGKQVANTIAKDYVNVSNLKDGVYIVKITEEGKTATRKLVIK
ncbi:T9SS type A sorting domain-containing protein, partial [Flavobacterium nitrogenifigens]|uniref:T9SS type A sorting domain-containing protein n=1 Tax=Flavobacterium nitrogenifigens TaxID=1617283 RepID=UPI0031A6D22E